MGWSDLMSVPGLTPRVASAALALVTAKTEKNYLIKGFSHELVDLPITAKSGTLDAVNIISDIPFGRTDCALPMLDAIKNDYKVDNFIIYTDSEIWYGDIHPVQALKKYRDYSGINAKLIVVAMEANDFTIADPDDPGMLDVVGFDSAVPKLISDFSAGKI